MRTVLFSLSIALFIVTCAHAQFYEDVLRLATQDPGFNARSLGLGMTNTGIASDFSAVYSNPAGLGQIKRNEVSLGFSFFSYSNDASFWGSSTSFANNTTDLNTLGFVYSFPASQRSIVLAAGVGRTPMFTAGRSFKGFNPSSSMVHSIDQNLAYGLHLIDSVNQSPIQDSVLQRGHVLEDGVLNNWLLSGSMEVTENLYLGASLNFISGSYTRTKDFSEYDVYNIYDTSRYSVKYALDHWNFYQQTDISIKGFTAYLGLLYKFNAHTRVGFTIKLPTHHTIEADSTIGGMSVFDTKDNQTQTNTYSKNFPHKTTTYGVTTPFTLGGGFSIGGDEIMFAGDVQYTDWTELQFTDMQDYPMLENYNTYFTEKLTSVFNVHAGVEVHMPKTTLHLRGGFAYLPSPKKGDPPKNDQKFITGGLGILIAKTVMIDLGFSYGFWEISHFNYGNNPHSETTEKISTSTLMTTISYRL